MHGVPVHIFLQLQKHLQTKIDGVAEDDAKIRANFDKFREEIGLPGSKSQTKKENESLEQGKMMCSVGEVALVAFSYIY